MSVFTKDDNNFRLPVYGVGGMMILLSMNQLKMRIVMLNGQNHKGSTYHIGRMIADKIPGNNEIREFFFPRDLNHFCVGCYKCIEDEKACPYYEEKKVILDVIEDADVQYMQHEKAKSLSQFAQKICI